MKQELTAYTIKLDVFARQTKLAEDGLNYLKKLVGAALILTLAEVGGKESILEDSDS